MYTLIDDDMIAEEGLFGPTNVSKLLRVAEKAINKKLHSPEDCDAYLERIQKESTLFNDALGQMAEAARQYKAGNIEKTEFKNTIKAASSSIKSEATMLKLSDINKSAQNVTDDEIANLRAYIIGVSDLVRNRKNELTASLSGSLSNAAEALELMVPGDTIVLEGMLYEMNEDYELEEAQEGLFAKLATRKAVKGEVSKMSLDDCMPLYAAYLQDKYGNRLVNDKEFYEDYIQKQMSVAHGLQIDTQYKTSARGDYASRLKLVKIGGQYFIERPGTAATERYAGKMYIYGVRGRNDNIGTRIVAGEKVRKTVIREMTAQRSAAEKTEKLQAGTEAMVEFLVLSGQCEDAMEAYDRIEDMTGLTPESFEISTEAFDGVKRRMNEQQIGRNEKNEYRALGKQAAKLMKSAKLPKGASAVETCRSAIEDLKEAKKLWAKCAKKAASQNSDEGPTGSYYDDKMDQCDIMIESWKSKMDSAKAADKQYRSYSKRTGAAESMIDYLESDEFDEELTPADEAYYDSMFGLDDDYGSYDDEY